MVKQYSSTTPGLSLAVPEDLEKELFKHLGKRRLLFKASGELLVLGVKNKKDPLFKLYEQLQKFVEEHKLFGSVVNRIPTEAEKAEARLKAEQAQFLDNLAQQSTVGALPLESFPPDTLLALAEKAGVYKVEQGKKRIEHAALEKLLRSKVDQRAKELTEAKEK